MELARRHKLLFAILSLLFVGLPQYIESIWSLVEKVQRVNTVHFPVSWLYGLTAPTGLVLFIAIVLQSLRQTRPVVDISLDPEATIRVSRGTGFVVRRAPVGASIESGTAPHSAAIMIIDEGFVLGRRRGITKWNQRYVFGLTFQIRGVPGGIARFTVGKSLEDKAGLSNMKGIGIEIDDHTLKGIVCDGRREILVDSKVGMVPDRVYSLEIVRGKNEIAWVLDGEKVARTQGGPSGEVKYGASSIQFEAANGVEGGRQYFRLHQLTLSA